MGISPATQVSDSAASFSRAKILRAVSASVFVSSDQELVTERADRREEQNLWVWRGRERGREGGREKVDNKDGVCTSVYLFI